MTNIVDHAEGLLGTHNYSVLSYAESTPPHLLFEGDTAIGFLIAYDTPADLLQHWRAQSERLLAMQRLGLKRSMEKAWNSYLLLLSDGPATELQQALLESVEEDLIGTRKIARAGVRSREETARAILPLLPLQSPPNLQPVNMKEEIRIRATQLPSQIVEGFLTARDQATIMQLLEES